MEYEYIGGCLRHGNSSLHQCRLWGSKHGCVAHRTLMNMGPHGLWDVISHEPDQLDVLLSCRCSMSL